MYLGGEFGSQGADHVVESGLLGRDAARRELRFHLREPDLGVCGPVRRELDTDGEEGRGGRCGGRSLVVGHAGCGGRSWLCI